MERGTTTFLKVAVFVIGVTTLALCIFLFPWLANYTAELYPEYAYLKYPVLIGLYITAVPGFLALFQSLKLLNYIESKKAFSQMAVYLLKLIKYNALAIIIVYIVGMFFLLLESALHPGIVIIGVAIMFAALCVSFFADVLQELLNRALEIKLENDLTV